MNIVPRRAESKARDDLKRYSIDCTQGLEGDTIASVTWTSRPQGLTFTDPTSDGQVIGVLIGSGAMGTEYRVIPRITKLSTGEVITPLVDNMEGIPLQVVGDPVGNQPNYRWLGSP